VSPLRGKKTLNKRSTGMAWHAAQCAGLPIKTRSSAAAERPLDALCLSVVSFNIPTAQFRRYKGY